MNISYRTFIKKVITNPYTYILNTMSEFEIRHLFYSPSIDKLGGTLHFVDEKGTVHNATHAYYQYPGKLPREDAVYVGKIKCRYASNTSTRIEYRSLQNKITS